MGVVKALVKVALVLGVLLAIGVATGTVNVKLRPLATSTPE